MHKAVAPPEVSAPSIMRALRDQPGLVALLGDWHDGGDVVAFRPARLLAPDEDPFAALAALPVHDAAGDNRSSASPSPDSRAAVFGGGWIGYLGYQLAGHLEALPAFPPRPTPLPHHHLAWYDHVLRRDVRLGWMLEAVRGADPERTARLRAVVDSALGRPAPAQPYHCGPVGSDVSGAEHAAAVQRALDHIRAGDVYQVNLCRRLGATFAGDPLDLFCAGYEALSPRFAAFVRLPGGAVASFSPELFLRRTGRSVLTSPIKGTAPLETDPAALAASGKNRAENIMIVDLMRNDLGRVSEPGTVAVDQLAAPQPHTGVHHLVSDVRGALRADVTDGRLLGASFPPGSCTGAPKVRAMEIITALERTAREVYTGAIGYAGPAGLTMNVAIRTFEFAGDRVWLGVGGGVVADSDPMDEAHETLVKARPLLAAVGARLDEALGVEWAEHAARAARPEPTMGVFSTALVDQGVVQCLDDHLARLAASAATLYRLPLPASLRADVVQAAAALSGAHRLRVEVAPGAEGLAHRVTATALPAGRRAPWRLVPVTVPGGLGAHKWADRRLLAAESGPWSPTCDPLLLDTDGAVLEAGRANVFAVLPDGVHTPALDGRILPGLARARVVAALAAARIPVIEGPLRLEDLHRASEVFVTNALVGAHPVVAVDGVGAWPPGPMARLVSPRRPAPRPAPAPSG
ncbi:bifunctional anthranilate synthase component I family protein/class IV aminotransferase [Georgenia ruanii]|uniref:Bifunctional aminodeoxychorismate synthase component I/aminodeoxychorismate lyase n=1 Tax=Georgenia ruanii TaxID=348442 RepID=A0A7J9V1R9_9MICO|nr:bifunctional anthranilate synthase component I family protein/class IV aminotransferase [Georgenia ruanii]MPV90543.1 bifunctional aminodeoxychorismate synthase component I/aminodeoxychorismate lyase [Georgenia ruanii]